MRYRKIDWGIGLWIAFLYLLAFLVDTPEQIWAGLGQILLSQDVLITDYFALAGPGAALFNSATVTLITAILLLLSKDLPNGFTIVVTGLMSGFAFFGKNFVNILPIIFGSILYCIVVKEPFAKHVNSALVGTSLAPIVSFAALSDGGWGMPALGLIMGLAIGFIISPLCAYTFQIQNGMNLYNGGFACGMLAMILVPILSAIGHAPTKAFYWATGYNTFWISILVPLCFIFMIGGIFAGGGKSALYNYWRLLNTSGRAPSDYLRMFGMPPVLINMGIDGLLATGYILAIGGDLNGPTVGGILTIIGFSAYGKHAFNILPIMSGFFLGTVFSHWSASDPSLQIAGLFCTTLAPISGYFGPWAGLLAGFLHSAVVLFAGSPVEGVNLYNNGFSGGIIAIVLYPVLMSAFKHRNPELQNKDYFDTFMHDEPLYPRFQHRYRKRHWVERIDEELKK